MRVLHLTTEFPPIIYGGLGTAVGGLVKASARAGIETGVLLFCPGASLSYEANLRQTAGADLFQAPLSADGEQIARLVLAWRPHLLHLHSFCLWPVTQTLRDRLTTPLVYTVHSLDRAENELGWGPPERSRHGSQQESVISGADTVVALSKSERALLLQYCPGAGPRIRVVGNGIDDIPFLGLQNWRQPAAPKVMFAGRFAEHKGIREFIEAIRLVLDHQPDVQFILAGGHRHSTAAQMAAWLLPSSLDAYRSRIHLTGWLTPEEMTACYRSADILVVPSRYEAFGMVILEGMLHGLVVAASAVGGPTEILQHKKTGYLFAPRDAQAIANSIIQLARDTPLRMRLASAGAREVRKRWLWPMVIKKMQRVYEQTCRQYLEERKPPQDESALSGESGAEWT